MLTHGLRCAVFLSLLVLSGCGPSLAEQAAANSILDRENAALVAMEKDHGERCEIVRASYLREYVELKTGEKAIPPDVANDTLDRYSKLMEMAPDADAIIKVQKEIDELSRRMKLWFKHEQEFIALEADSSSDVHRTLIEKYAALPTTVALTEQHARVERAQKSVTEIEGSLK